MRTGGQDRERQAGFTLMELLITIAVLLVIVLVAIPNVTGWKVQANQNSAMESLRSIYQAEVKYEAVYPDHGFSCSLAQMGGDAAAPTPEKAGLLQADLAGGRKSGYTFKVAHCFKDTSRQHSQNTSFELTAEPEIVGKTGHSGYCIDRYGKMRFDPTGGTNCTETSP